MAIDTETRLRMRIRDAMTLTRAPAFIRLSFHDAGTYQPVSHAGGAHGSIHLSSELARKENAPLHVCIELLQAIKDESPDVSWADLIAIGGAAAVEKCGGPIILVGMGRVDAEEASPEHGLPTIDESADELKRYFVDRLGLTVRDLVALSGGHTVGGPADQPFTPDRHAFTNSYFKELLRGADDARSLLATDRVLADDPETRAIVEEYAADQGRFYGDFAAAFRRVTWIGSSDREPARST